MERGCGLEDLFPSARRRDSHCLREKSRAPAVRRGLACAAEAPAARCHRSAPWRLHSRSLWPSRGPKSDRLSPASHGHLWPHFGAVSLPRRLRKRHQFWCQIPEPKWDRGSSSLEGGNRKDVYEGSVKVVIPGAPWSIFWHPNWCHFLAPKSVPLLAPACALSGAHCSEISGPNRLRFRTRYEINLKLQLRASITSGASTSG